MNLFKKKETGKKQGKYGNRILVKSGKDDWRSYPEPGSLFHIEITPDHENYDMEENHKEN